MKKILVGIAAISLVLLCSCSCDGEKASVSDSQKENITASSTVKTEAAVSADLTEEATDAPEVTLITTEKPEEITDVVSPETTSESPVENTPQKPDQKFIGVWSTDEYKTDQILIYDLTEVSVKFNTGISGLFGFDATAMLMKGEFVFGDGISPGYSGPDGVRGKLRFSENSITVIYDDFGSIEYAEGYPNEYTFTIKDENSDAIVSQYKEAN